MFIYPRIPEETKARYEMLYKSGIIIEHLCKIEGWKVRHGTILNIKKQHVNEIHAMLIFYFGDKCAWAVKNPDNTTSLEFVYQGNDRQMRPWYYCGTSVLFEDWHEREDNNLNILSEFHVGDDVQFVFRGVRYQGMIANLRKRATVIVKGRGKFYVPAKELEKVE